METFESKLVETPHYHLWTDALHLRAIAQQTTNRWDRGTYVRCTVTTAWTALELACKDALQVDDIGNRFREKLDRAVKQGGLPKLDWSQGVWKKVSELHVHRNEFVHHGISDRNRFAEADVANGAIDVCRRAIKAIYAHAGKTGLGWVDDDTDPGFDIGRPPATANLTLQHADPQHPDTVRTAYVYKDQEFSCDYFPAGTCYGPLLDDMIKRMRVPISAVRAYRGNELLEERDLLMRGN